MTPTAGMPTSPSSSEIAAAGDKLAAAVAYAAAGLPVFPLAGKIPRTVDGLKAATTDAEQVRSWWQRWPDADIGIRTGIESGVIVLDIDVQHGGQRTLLELERAHGKVSATPEVLTGGGGKHLYFRHPGVEVRNSAGKLGHGVDLRGDGGYVVAPPSVHENGRVYCWTRPLERGLSEPPAWLLEDARRRRNGRAEPVESVIPQGRRRDALVSLAGTMRRRGMADPEIAAALHAVNDGRCRPPLPRDEVDELASDVAGRYAPDAATAIRTEPDVAPQQLEQVVAVFREWLHLPDAGAVYATLATVAANRVAELDPLWLLVVGPSGGGKTETLAAVGGLADVHQAATLTEAALLSGTSRKEKAASAKGGLLRELGDFGVLMLKDFGSVLSMHRDARAAVLAALREIYDGSWTRHVGTDGGQVLSWNGKMGLVAGATPAIDQHHAVLAQLGERFVFYRLQIGDAAAQARRSLRHQGRERQMRAALREAVCGLFATIDLSELPPVDGGDEDRLVALSTLVARARSAVIRDSYRRELELVPDAEAPGRLIGALGRMLTGLRLIGADDETAWRIVAKCGLDSMPATRRQALEYLIDSGEAAPTTVIATTLGLPNPSARRVLEDLAAHGLVARESQGQGKPDLWAIELWAAEQWRIATSSEMSEGGSATSSEMSEHSPITQSKYAFDDFSEKVST